MIFTVRILIRLLGHKKSARIRMPSAKIRKSRLAASCTTASENGPNGSAIEGPFQSSSD